MPNELPSLSRVGALLAGDSPINLLMRDLAEALQERPQALFLGGGNPAQIPAVTETLAQALGKCLQDPAALLGVYQAPQGNEPERRAVAGYLVAQLGWPVAPEHICFTAGSQTAFFILHNLFAGAGEGGHRCVYFPVMPEYVGYAGQALAAELFEAPPPSWALTDAHRFKYHWAGAPLPEHTGAVSLSLPTNPSGNVLAAGELAALSRLAQEARVPLIHDLAYGAPFPNCLYTPAATPWADHHVYVLSLSKLGAPGLRTAVVVAPPAIAQAVSRAHTALALAANNLGPALLRELIQSGALRQLADDTLPNFYRAQRDVLVAALDRELAGLPYRLHEPEGAFFLWLWLEGLPGGSRDLYQTLKRLDLIVMAGEPFFFGFDQPGAHTRECLRLTYCQPRHVLERAAAVLGAELRRRFA